MEAWLIVKIETSCVAVQGPGPQCSTHDDEVVETLPPCVFLYAGQPSLPSRCLGQSPTRGAFRHWDGAKVPQSLKSLACDDHKTNQASEEACRHSAAVPHSRVVVEAWFGLGSDPRIGAGIVPFT